MSLRHNSNPKKICIFLSKSKREKLSFQYNSWPLGNLPENWQRQEPYLLRDAGYVWDDPRDINLIFESKLAEYAGAKFAILTDCCTNGLFLSLQYRLLEKKLRVGQDVSLPVQSYVSVPMIILQSGMSPVFVEEKWSGMYQLGESGIWDSAARFTEMMYVGGDALQVLSFQIKKRLPIGRGGVILTDDASAYAWLKRAVYDGRDLTTRYTDPGHVSQIGWHFYMTPEDAARGILIMDALPNKNEDTMNYENYPPLDSYDYFGGKR
jgi:hypothetical protein